MSKTDYEETPEDIKNMAETIIPDGLVGYDRVLLHMAVCFGMQMERERQESDRRVERLKKTMDYYR